MRELALIRCIRASRLPASQKSVAIEMALLANGDEGRCTASLETLCEETSLARNTVKAAITALLDTGWLVQLKAATPRTPAQYGVRVPGGQIVTPRGSNREGQNATPRGSNQTPQGVNEGVNEGVKSLPRSGLSGGSDLQPPTPSTDVPSAAARTNGYAVQLPPPRPGATPEPDPQPIAELLALQQEEEPELIVNRKDQDALRQAFRRGDQPERLRHLWAFSLDQGVRIRRWSVLLSPSMADLRQRSDVDLDRQRRRRVSATPSADQDRPPLHDPTTPLPDAPW